MDLSSPRLRNANRRQLASSETPHGVGEEFSSPLTAIITNTLLPNTGSGVVGAKATHFVPPVSGASLSSIVPPCPGISGSGGDGAPAGSVASQATTLSANTLFAHVSTRSITWAFDARPELATALGPRQRIRRALYPASRNGCGEACAAVPYHIPCGDLFPGLAGVAV